MSTDVLADNASKSQSLSSTEKVINDKSDKKAFTSLNGPQILKQISLILVLAIFLTVLIFIFFWLQGADYRPLKKMDTGTMVSVLDLLDKERIDYQIDLDVIKVAEQQYQKVKLLLAREGLNSGNQSTDFLSKDSGFGVSQQMEQARLKFNREQNLAKVIEELHSVSRAKVILAIPKTNVFAKMSAKPSATVVITTANIGVEQETVDAIVDIVSSAVEGLQPARVTVTDANGRLLNSGSQTGVSSKARREQELIRQKESEYAQKIEAILMPILGPEDFTSQVAVMMDFTSKEETAKRYDPKSSVVRSEMTVENQSLDKMSGGVPGALTNQPKKTNEQTSSDKKSIDNSHKEATRNYELDTVISHTKQQVGIIKRVSVSVAVDHKSVIKDGNVTKEERSQAEMQSIRVLLEGAVGFDKNRGDIIQIANVPFIELEMPATIPLAFWEQNWFWQIIKFSLVSILVLMIIFMFIRPTFKKIVDPSVTKNSAMDNFHHNDLAELEDQYAAQPIGLLAAPNQDYSYADDGSIQIPDLHKDEDMIKSVRAIVNNEPELSTQVVTNWLKDDD